MGYRVMVDDKRVASGIDRATAIEVASLVEGSRVFNEETGDEVVNSHLGVIREIPERSCCGERLDSELKLKIHMRDAHGIPF